MSWLESVVVMQYYNEYELYEVLEAKIQKNYPNL